MQDYKKGAESFYFNNKKGELESVSGHSSTLLSTYHFREHLKKLLKAKKIKSISDCPCGDWNWMRTVKLDGIKYTGYDILEPIINYNSENYKEDNVTFKVFDAVTEVLPKSDLIICKDFLTHLKDDLIKKVIENFKKSKSKYLLSTSYTKDFTISITGDWGFKEVNLDHFGLTPIERFNDSSVRFHGLYELK